MPRGRRSPPRGSGRSARSGAPGPRPSRSRASAGRRRIPASSSGRDRSVSVSSMRSSSVPPCDRANSALSSAVSALPRCSDPVGLGAKRTWTDTASVRARPSAAGRARAGRARAGSSTRRPGFWLSIDANAADVSTIRRAGPAAVAVAVRGPWSISAISPRKSPGPSRLSSLPPRSITIDPSRTMKNSPPRAPSRVSTFPSGTSTSSMILPRNSISRLSAPRRAARTRSDRAWDRPTARRDDTGTGAGRGARRGSASICAARPGTARRGLARTSGLAGCPQPGHARDPRPRRAERSAVPQRLAVRGGPSKHRRGDALGAVDERCERWPPAAGRRSAERRRRRIRRRDRVDISGRPARARRRGASAAATVALAAARTTPRLARGGRRQLLRGRLTPGAPVAR